MTLQDIFDDLAYGELSQVVMGGFNADQQGIPVEQRKRVFSHVVIGLTELHKRFLLREQVLRIDLVSGQTMYQLERRFAKSNTQSREVVKYINDTADPWNTELFMIERVYDDQGKELLLNAIDNADSVRTPTYKSLVLPSSYAGTFIDVVCRADHTRISPHMIEEGAAQIEVHLPRSHLQALLLFIASRVHNPIGIQQEFHQGNNFLQKFEIECERLKLGHNETQQENEVSRFTRNGWV